MFTLAYYGLREREAESERMLSARYGFRSSWPVSARIRAVLHYLDPSFHAGAIARAHARTLLTRTLPCLRRQEAERNALASRVAAAEKANGGEALPEGLPKRRIGIFEQIAAAKKDGRIAELELRHPRLARVIWYRYGIGYGSDREQPRRFRTLEETGEFFNSVTQERIRQMEKRAFKILGIGPNTLT